MRYGNEIIRTIGSFTGKDMQTTQGVMFYLTNALGEEAHWDRQVFDALGVPYTWNNEADCYPLTNEESQFIRGDAYALRCPLLSFGREEEVLCGYSMWWKNKKWLAPSIECGCDPENPHAREETMQMVEQLADGLSTAMSLSFGIPRFLINATLHDRITLVTLFNITIITACYTADAYFQRLERIFGSIGYEIQSNERRRLLHSPELP